MAKERIRRSRGRELSGTFNPMVIGELFVEQCEPWQRIASNVKLEILRAVHEVTKAIVDHIAISETTSGILSLVGGYLETWKSELEAEFTALLKPYVESHPITFNHYLTDTVQKAQAERRRKSLNKQFREIIGNDEFASGQKICIYPARVLNQLEQRIEVDMERHGSELAVDYMEAYYKVSIELRSL